VNSLCVVVAAKCKRIRYAVQSDLAPDRGSSTLTGERHSLGRRWVGLAYCASWNIEEKVVKTTYYVLGAPSETEFASGCRCAAYGDFQARDNPYKIQFDLEHGH